MSEKTTLEFYDSYKWTYPEMRAFIESDQIALAKARAEIERLKESVIEHDQLFDLRWKADCRAIKMWRKAHPGKELCQPDHADLCVWLMGEIGRLKELGLEAVKCARETSYKEGRVAAKKKIIKAATDYADGLLEDSSTEFPWTAVLQFADRIPAMKGQSNDQG